MDILIALLVNFRDKGIVFIKTCCLLVLLCRDESIAQEISVKKRSIQDIKSVLNITERNYKLEAKRSKIKSTAENTTCHLAPVTPRKHAPHTVIRQGSVDVAQDPLQAVRLLVHRLGIASAANWDSVVEWPFQSSFKPFRARSLTLFLDWKQIHTWPFSHSMFLYNVMQTQCEFCLVFLATMKFCHLFRQCNRV